MRRPRDHALRGVGVFFVVALALVPVALSGHHHAATESPQNPCAACVATHHAPAANLALLPRVTPILHSFRLTAADVTAPAHVFRPFKTGRAPPTLFTLRVA